MADVSSLEEPTPQQIDATVPADRCPKCGGENEYGWQWCHDCLSGEVVSLRVALQAAEATAEGMKTELNRVHRLSGVALARPDRTLTVYELNRALRGTDA